MHSAFTVLYPAVSLHVSRVLATLQDRNQKAAVSGSISDLQQTFPDLESQQ